MEGGCRATSAFRLQFYSLRSARLLPPLLLSQNTVNAFSDLLGFFYLVFERVVLLI